MTEPQKEQKPNLKRGAYRKKECPFCHKFFGNLGNHINEKHKTPGGQGEAPPPPPEPPGMSKDTLLGKGAAVKTAPLSPQYYCTSCRAELRKGENPCWNCGETLIWEGII
jgi:hypothetical protein